MKVIVDKECKTHFWYTVCANRANPEQLSRRAKGYDNTTTTTQLAVSKQSRSSTVVPCPCYYKKKNSTREANHCHNTSCSDDRGRAVSQTRVSPGMIPALPQDKPQPPGRLRICPGGFTQAVVCNGESSPIHTWTVQLATSRFCQQEDA